MNGHARFKHVPHPHIAARREQGPVKLRAGRLSLNDRIARRVTLWFGTMMCAYAFAVYGTLGALFPAKQNTLLYWSNWIQLVALPLLAVGAVVLGRATEARNKQAFDDGEAVLHEAAQTQEHLAAQDEHLTAQDAKLAELVDRLDQVVAHLTTPPASGGPL